MTPPEINIVRAEWDGDYRIRLDFDDGSSQTVDFLPFLAACRTLVVDSENGPRRGQFLPVSPGNSRTIAQESGEKWTGAALSQPTIPKSDRLLGRSTHPDIRVFLQPELFCAFRLEYGELVWGDYELCFPTIDLYRNRLDVEYSMAEAA